MGTPIDGAGSRGFGATRRGRTEGSLAVDKGGGWVGKYVKSIGGCQTLKGLGVCLNDLVFTPETCRLRSRTSIHSSVHQGTVQTTRYTNILFYSLAPPLALDNS